MELWIRTQNKEKLFKVDNLEFLERNGHKYIASNMDLVASYKTKERALEILDEIQENIDPKPRWICTQHTEFDNKEGGLIGFATYKEEPKIERISDVIVYEMPKE